MIRNLCVRDTPDASENLLRSKLNAIVESFQKYAATGSVFELIRPNCSLVSKQDENGNTPLHLALHNKNIDVFFTFVDVAASMPHENIINMKNGNQLTVLSLAASLDKVEACKYLLDSKADITITDMQDCNIAHVACIRKNLQLLKVNPNFTKK